MFLFGVAYWTSHRIHYDPEWARAEGFGDLLVTANLLSAYSVEG
jgi:hydroxyacyl-ACP dehydratase HTD2-like protein with hotdog domain